MNTRNDSFVKVHKPVSVQRSSLIIIAAQTSLCQSESVSDQDSLVCHRHVIEKTFTFVNVDENSLRCPFKS